MIIVFLLKPNFPHCLTKPKNPVSQQIFHHPVEVCHHVVNNIERDASSPLQICIRRPCKGLPKARYLLSELTTILTAQKPQVIYGIILPPNHNERTAKEQISPA